MLYWKSLSQRFEAPTWLLIVTIYGGWLALTLCWHALPTWLIVPIGAWLCAWHMSLQHELMHGHPTRNATLNDLLGAPPLNLWLPYALYREQHLLHHRADTLTDPLEDPESTYMSPEAWAAASPARRLLHQICNTLAGRLVLGPLRTITAFWLRQARIGPSNGRGRIWLDHALAAGVVLTWVCGICHISLLAYAACFIYPGTALTLIRSLAEHRAAALPQDRTAVVENAGLLGLLFLNNNLHVLHHERPSIPWFALPAHWRSARLELLRNGPVYRGYRDVAARYAWRPQHAGPHPIIQTVEMATLLTAPVTPG